MVIINKNPMEQQPAISLQSVHNLIYKLPADHPDPEQFAQLMDRHKKNKQIYHNKSQLRKTLTTFLIPQNEKLRKEVNFSCEQKKQAHSKKDVLEKRCNQVYARTNKLGGIDGDQKAELMNFYKNELSKMDIQRKAVVRTKQNETRLSKISYQELKPKSPDMVGDRSPIGFQEVQSRVSSPAAIKQKFNNLISRGIVEDYTPFGSQEQIELETLKLLRDKRVRFNKSTTNRTEYLASNYLSGMLSEEELMLKNRLAQEEALKKQVRAKSTGKSEPTYQWYKKAPETKRLMKLIQTKDNRNKAQELIKKLEETDKQQEEERKHHIQDTFIPFINERNSYGKLFEKSFFDQKSQSQQRGQVEPSRVGNMTPQTSVISDTVNFQIQKSSVNLDANYLPASNHAHFVHSQLSQKNCQTEAEKPMTRGDVIIPSSKESGRSTSHLLHRHHRLRQAGPSHISPLEVLELVDTARETTNKLNRKIKNSTFDYDSNKKTEQTRERHSNHFDGKKLTIQTHYRKNQTRAGDQARMSFNDLLSKKEAVNSRAHTSHALASRQKSTQGRSTAQTTHEKASLPV